ncbi:hypothetical protein [Falsibacillus pallidus]|uniref:Membrane protein NfeD2 N-terminal transmembrane domain-containing protein n=1 Tax=Falsibacillus pallidus TaxID=493781 RepID=A0A370GF14_9BACI|nr:hypothetical protein [Falsibacillus pallidus]RDI42277.1 hypothetical protein DFR59_105117 [Falsibacillus pallidus]
MELFGTAIESIYLTILIVSGSLIVLYVLFSDLLHAIHGIADPGGWINPAVVLAFFTFVSASGYILEFATGLGSMTILVISILIALVLDSILNIFVFIPLSRAEESLGYTEDSLRGRIGKVILSIPVDGYGEVLIESKSGVIAKSAKSFDEESITEGTRVLIIDVKQGVVFVSPQEEL